MIVLTLIAAAVLPVSIVFAAVERPLVRRKLPVQEHGPDLIPVPIGPRGRGHITDRKLGCGASLRVMHGPLGSLGFLCLEVVLNCELKHLGTRFRVAEQITSCSTVLGAAAVVLTKSDRFGF